MFGTHFTSSASTYIASGGRHCCGFTYYTPFPPFPQDSTSPCLLCWFCWVVFLFGHMLQWGFLWLVKGFNHLLFMPPLSQRFATSILPEDCVGPLLLRTYTCTARYFHMLIPNLGGIIDTEEVTFLSNRLFYAVIPSGW